MTKIQTTIKSSSNGKHNDSSQKGKPNGGGQTLKKLFENELKDIYSAEKQLVEALPEMAKAADSEELQDAIQHHLQETRRHVVRLEKVFDRLRIDRSEEKECAAMKGLIEEGKQIIEEYEIGPVRDAALIIGAQKVEHYEIAAYGSICELANVLGFGRVEDLLCRTLDEEGEADKTLSEIAQRVNDEACEAHDEHYHAVM